MAAGITGVAIVRRFAGIFLTAALVPIAASSSALAQIIPTGRYECWYFSTPLPGFNFTLMGEGRYIDAEGNSGAYRVYDDGIRFSGGALDGQRGIYRVGPPPTIAFMGTGGRETESCQLVR